MNPTTISIKVFHLPGQASPEAVPNAGTTNPGKSLRDLVEKISEKLGVKPQESRSATSYTLSTGEVLDAPQIAQLSDKLLAMAKEKLLSTLCERKISHGGASDSHLVLICNDPDFVAIGPSIPNPDGFQRLSCVCNDIQNCETCKIHRLLDRINAEVRDELDID